VDLTSSQLKTRVALDLNSEAGRVQLRSIQTQALRALVREQVVEQMAALRKISLTAADLDAEVARVTETLGGSAELAKRLDQNGETMADLPEPEDQPAQGQDDGRFPHLRCGL